jgi:hypothetical protein
MNRLGLSVLAVALAAAGTLSAQDSGSVGPTPVTSGKDASQTAVSQAPTAKVIEQAVPKAPEAAASSEVIVQPVPDKLLVEPSVTKLAGDSHVRIVRLSQVQGKVGMDRGAGHGVELAMQNMPIVEGMLLGTASDASYAEVEFEDGSTMRLGPGTAVKFSQLVTRATGAKSTVVRVDRGTIFVSRENTKNDEFTLAARGMRKMTVQPATHMRVELEGTKTDVAVFSGSVAVEGNGEPVMVGKKQTLSVDVADKSAAAEVAKGVDEGPYDGWDKDLQKYHDQYAKGNSLLGGKGFGVSDLNYYGSFQTVGGCGTFWQPYFVSSSWSPYGTGVWAQYGGGYSWVSPYPWGWLPFHSGGWSYCPSQGWGWQPGGTFLGVNNIAIVQAPCRNSPAHVPGCVLPRPPVDAKTSMVVAGNQPLVVSKPVAGGTFVFEKNSAGMGVPRGSLGKLNGFSNDAARHGVANSRVYVAPAGSPSRWNDGQVYHGPLTMHRGSMPDEARQAMWAREQAAANGSLGAARAGQLDAGRGDHRGSQTAGQNGVAAGWQGQQRQGQLNSSGNNLGWKGQQNGANAGANANGSHSWNNGGAGAGAGAGGNGHTWNNAGAGAGAGAGGNGHTWNNAGAGAGAGGNPGGSAGGGGHNWGGGGGGQGASAGGGGHNWGGGSGGGGSAGAGNGGGHSGGGGGGGNGGGGGGNAGGGGNSSSSGGSGHK